jgi:hypothetical protein
MMRHRTRVAIQAAIEVRDAAGGVAYEWETIPALADVAATVVPDMGERDGERRDDELVTVEDRYNVILAGHHPEIRPEMVVLDGTSVYDIIRVAPTLGRRETVLVARQVAI